MTSAGEKDLVTDIAALLGEMVIRCHLAGLTVSDSNLLTLLESCDLSHDPYWHTMHEHAVAILNDDWSDDEKKMDPDRARR